MNPLLSKFDTPFETIPFDKLRDEHFLEALEQAVKEARQEIEDIKNSSLSPDFENSVAALDRSGKKMSVVSSAFFTLNSTDSTEERQKIAREVSRILTEFSNDIMLDEALFARIKQVYDAEGQKELNTEQKRLLDKTYKNFVRNGALLGEDQKQEMRELDNKLSQASLRFRDNVLAGTNSYEMEITDPKDLEGLPESAIEAARSAAEQKGKEGKWLFTLDHPSFSAIITYCNNRSLREEIYKAFGSRAYLKEGQDNRENIKEIVRLRHQRARLLGYGSHSDFILEERMAGSTKTVMDFAEELFQKALPKAKEEVEELKEYARKTGGPADLQSWDYSFYLEKLKKEKFNVDDEILRPYLKLENVVQGVFQSANRLYGLKFNEIKNIPVYHQEVKTFEVQDENGRHLGLLYTDFFPRPGKRAGAWANNIRDQKKEIGVDQRPHAAIVCNFTPPTPTRPPLLTLNEVLTLFHEFGHALHALLSDCTYQGLSSHSVYWDFVELPSQIMENWVYEKECLDLFAVHYETGERIPGHLVQKIKESSNFGEGAATIRQISFVLLDMAWHGVDPGEVEDVGAFERKALKKTRLLPEVLEINSSCQFSHIFAGGYSAGYYSYKWAEVLDADAFELFKEKGIFCREIASQFKEHILSKGGSEHPMELYKRFRGKGPTVDALLRRSGLL